VRRLIVLASMILFATSAWAQQPGVMGTWLTEAGTAQIKVEPCADAKSGPICGRIVGLINPKGPDGKVVAPDTVVDSKNENASLRSREMIGIPLFWGFKPTTDPNAFEGGQIYNGEDGKIYTANIGLQPDGKLRLRGYVGSPMFGKTQLWTRIIQ
jgi:uncharacterized protein (DUF2147 family)